MDTKELIKKLQAEFDNNQRRFLGGLIHSTKFNQWFNEALRRVIDQEIERKKGVRKIHREFECNGAHNGKGCYENWCDMKTCISKDALHCKSYNQAIDEDIAHLTSLKELIK